MLKSFSSSFFAVRALDMESRTVRTLISDQVRKKYSIIARQENMNSFGRVRTVVNKISADASLSVS